MESEPIFETLELNDILILYKEEDAYVYAKNIDGALVIERAFVPPTQVIRAKAHSYPIGISLESGVAGEDIQRGDCVCVSSGGLVEKAKPVKSGSYTSNSKECDDCTLKAGFDINGNPIVTCGPNKESKQKLDEWINKCNDLNGSNYKDDEEYNGDPREFSDYLDD